MVGCLSNPVVVLGKVSRMSKLRQVTQNVCLFPWFESWYNNVFIELFDENFYILPQSCYKALK